MSQDADFHTIRDEIDKYLYPTSNPFSDDGLNPTMGAGKSDSGKVGIDTSRFQRVDDMASLFDEDF